MPPHVLPYQREVGEVGCLAGAQPVPALRGGVMEGDRGAEVGVVERQTLDLTVGLRGPQPAVLELPAEGRRAAVAVPPLAPDS